MKTSRLIGLFFGLLLSLLPSLLLGAAGPALATTLHLETTPVPIPALLDETGALRPVFSVALDPAERGLIVVDRQDQVYFAPWRGPWQRLDSFRGPGESFSRPMQLRATGPGLLFTRRQPARVELYDHQLQTAGTLAPRFYTPWPMALVGQKLFKIGAPVIPPPQAEKRWEDLSWRRQYARTDCRVSVVDLSVAEPRETPLVCDPTFESATGRILPGGDVIVSADGSTVFAVTEASPRLSIIEVDSPTDKKVRHVSYLEEGETFPRFTKADEQLQFRSRGPEAALALRDRFDWFQGFLRWRDHIGLVFRRWDGERAQFLVDVFDLDGVKVANDLPLLLPLSSNESGRLTHLTFLNGAEGKAWVFVRSRTARGEIEAQQLFRVALDQEQLQSQLPRENLRFRLADLTTGSPIDTTRLTLRAAGKHRFRDLQGLRGLFAMHIPPEVPTRVEIQAPGYRQSNLEVLTRPGDTTDLGTLYLDPGVTIQGHLLHRETGEPLTGASVHFLRPGAWGGLAARHFDWKTTVTTDAAGRFSVRGLEAGTQCLEVTHPAVAPTPLIVEQLQAQEQRDLGSVFIGSQARVEVRVVDLDDQVRAGIEVELRAGSVQQPCVRLTALSQQDGIAEFPAVATGPYLVVARDHGVIQKVQPVSVEPSNEQHLDDLVLAVRHIEGSVRVGGQPARDGLVVLTPASDPRYSPPPVFVQRPGSDRQQLVNDLQPNIVATVSERGEFDAEGYLPETDLVATYTSPEGLELRQVVASLTTSRLELDFSGGEIYGTATTSGGEALSGAWIRLRSSLPDQDHIDLRTSRSASDGSFRLSHVPPGQYRVLATSEAGPVQTMAQEVVELAAEPARPLHLQLQPQLHRELVARILTRSGQPAAGATLLVTDRQRTHVIQVADVEGLARFPALPPGDYDLLATASGSLHEGPTVQLPPAGSIQTVLQLGETEPADLHFTDPDAIGQLVQLETPGGISAQPLLSHLGITPRVDWSGDIDLPRLSPGEWRAELRPSP